MSKKGWRITLTYASRLVRHDFDSLFPNAHLYRYPSQMVSKFGRLLHEDAFLRMVFCSS
jgi:hypothetical protein